MAFNPSSTIYLCGVPIDNTYKNQIYFESKADQETYFLKRVLKTFTEYTTVRKALADGGVQSKIKVEANIDTLYECNYMYYRNENHGTRFFYAFITNLIYVNEGVTEIEFEVDVWQTWQFDITLLSSYVVREHSATDNIGDNIVPEKFTFQDYVYKTAPYTNPDAADALDISDYGYMVGLSKYIDLESSPADSTGSYHSGIFQGLYFYFFNGIDGINSFMNIINDEGVECVEFINVIPKFLKPSVWGEQDAEWGFVENSTAPKEQTANFNLGGDSLKSNCFEGFEPKNNKLYTSPFVNLTITNNAGSEAEYNIEDFGTHPNVSFTMYGDISPAPSVTLIPNNYKGASKNVDFGISISGFPQCSFVTDTYKLWLNKNEFSNGVSIAANMAQIIAGIAMTAGSGGTAGAIGGTQIVSGVSGILGTIGSVYSASKQPNGSNSGSMKNNLLTAMKRNRFNAFIRSIKKEYAEIIDDFFTAYGYQVNRVKIPNISSRPKWNYVETMNCNIKGKTSTNNIEVSIPCGDMQKLKAMFNNGVTFWKKDAVIGLYSVDNSPQ